MQAWKPDAGGSLVFYEKRNYSPLVIACGQCIGCRLERSRQWAMRCVHENQMHDFSSFITLTYDDENVPVDYSLRYVDFQLFMKRLRARVTRARQRMTLTDVRFYMCGEYGDLGRPHFHALLFGVFFNDRKFWRLLPSGSNLYTSDELDSLWPYGFTSIGDVTFESAAYVARYVVKKITGPAAFEHYKRVSPDGEVYWVVPEFTHMSLKPGIGAAWFDKFRKEVYPSDRVVIRGREMRPPRYYDRLVESCSDVEIDFVRLEREHDAMKHVLNNMPVRLAVRERCSRARLLFKKRSI